MPTGRITEFQEVKRNIFFWYFPNPSKKIKGLNLKQLSWEAFSFLA